MENQNPAVDLAAIAALSAAELAKLLAVAKQAEKAKADEIAALPMFAFVLAMTDGTYTYWSGKAVDYDAATVAAIAHAERDGKEVYTDPEGRKGIAPRPLPAPRGRKAKATD